MAQNFKAPQPQMKWSVVIFSTKRYVCFLDKGIGTKPFFRGSNGHDSIGWTRKTPQKTRPDHPEKFSGYQQPKHHFGVLVHGFSTSWMEEVRDIGHIGISSRMWCYLHTCEIQSASWKVEITPRKFWEHALNSILQSFYILDHPTARNPGSSPQAIDLPVVKGICSGISGNRKLTSFWHRQFSRDHQVFWDAPDEDWSYFATLNPPKG